MNVLLGARLHSVVAISWAWVGPEALPNVASGDTGGSLVTVAIRVASGACGASSVGGTGGETKPDWVGTPVAEGEGSVTGLDQGYISKEDGKHSCFGELRHL